MLEHICWKIMELTVAVLLLVKWYSFWPLTEIYCNLLQSIAIIFFLGKSTHNQRIERLWRDVFEGCLDLFYEIFSFLMSWVMCKCGVSTMFIFPY